MIKVSLSLLRALSLSLSLSPFTLAPALALSPSPPFFHFLSLSITHKPLRINRTFLTCIINRNAFIDYAAYGLLFTLN